MSETLRAAILFLITTLFDLYLFLLIVRLILAWVNADYFHPATQFVVTCTNFVVKPVRNVVKSFGNLETATVVVILVVEIIKFFFVSILSFGFPNIFGLIILAFADAIKLILETFFYAILLQAILTWLQPGAPINLVLEKFTAPVLRPFQRFIPPISGFDISPIPALILLQLLVFILANQLIYLGWRVAFV